MSNLVFLIAEAQRGRWCATWGCTTCGARELGNALEQCRIQCGSAEALARDAAAQADFPPTDVHTFILRWLSWEGGADLTEWLGASSAGLLHDRMLAAKREADERRAAHARRNDPAFVAAERARKKAEKAARREARHCITLNMA